MGTRRFFPDVDYRKFEYADVDADLSNAEISTRRFRCWLVLPGLVAGVVLGAWVVTIQDAEWHAGLGISIVLVLSGVVRSHHWSRKTLDGQLKRSKSGTVLLLGGREFRVDLVELDGTNFAPFARFPSGDSVTVRGDEGTFTVRYFDRILPR